ncbi:MAG: class II aldolase/adducin family protein [Deltaproteobacteria bacterium]|nr:class II aldolase/adducin family protein [Deltaproteobacteria bacterium]
MADKFKDIKDRVALGVRILAYQGVFPLALGHVSEKVPGEDLICILSGGVHDRGGILENIGAAEIVVINLDGELVEGEMEPPGERFIHTEIYRSRPEIRSVVHAHPPITVALSAAGQEVLPITARAALFSPSVKIFPHHGQIDNPPIGGKVAAALGQAYALVLRGHGSVTVGESVEAACMITLTLEETARQQWIAAAFGKPQPLPAGAVDEGGRRPWHSPSFYRAAWSYYCAQLTKS